MKRSPLKENDRVTVVSGGSVNGREVGSIHEGIAYLANGNLVSFGRVLRPRDEGIKWARGWGTPEADALRALRSL